MDQDPSTRHVLEGRELIDYLVEKASGATNAELLGREERRNRRTAALLSVLTFVGVGAIVGAIKMFVQQEITLSEQRVREQVTATLDEQYRRRQEEFENTVTASIAGRVDQQVGAVRDELQHYKLYQELLAHSETIAAAAEEGKIADKAIDLAFDAIRALGKVESIRGQPRFLDAAYSVIDLLVRTDRKREIDEIDALLGDVLGRHRSASLDLADHYGELIIASPYAVERLPREAAALDRYVRASREHSYPEKALMWELFVAYKSNGFEPDATTQSLVQMVQDLRPADLDELCYQLVLHSHPLHWMQKPDHEGRELARLVGGLLEDHPLLRETIEQRSADPTLADRLQTLAQRRIERSGGPVAPLPFEAQPLAPEIDRFDGPASPTEIATRPADNTLRR